MAVYGIVAEYNPFHNGHKYQLDVVRSHADCSGVVAVMSGNFVQRGEAAVLPKQARVQMALMNGVDLVLELPVPFATATAEKFAEAAVYILSATGAVDKLSFGSESGDIALLAQTARAVLSDEMQCMIQEELKQGKSYPAARGAAVERCCGAEIASVLKAPNNILAVEYIKAIFNQNSPIIPSTVLRCGAAHDSTSASGNQLSASAIRELIRQQSGIADFVPENAHAVFKQSVAEGFAPASMKKMETAILASLRMKSSSDFKNIPDVSEGIENRILAAAQTSHTLEALYDAAKTKRYTHSRIRRIVLCSFLNLSNDFVSATPPYIRVLGWNTCGQHLLRTMKKSAALPIVKSAADIKKTGGAAVEFYNLENKTTNIFNMMLPRIRPCGTEMTDNPVIFE